MALGAVLLLGAAVLRGAEYDESYTDFLATGTARPVWPDRPFTIGEARDTLAGSSNMIGIARDLRRHDVHPPLYFWMVAAWRGVLGPSLLATRGFSVLCAVLALGLVGAIARRIAVPVLPAMLITVGCYGFVYTGAIARGFALAQLLNLTGIWVLLRPGGPGAAFLAGIALGAASFSNYLAGFIGAAVLAWAVLARPRSVWLPVALGFALLLPADLWFFLAQRGSRTAQFPPFAWGASLGRLGQYMLANIFGGLPLYVGPARTIAAWLLAVGAAGLGGLLVWHWRRLGGQLLLGLCAGAPAIGLLALGVLFNTTPIELRYLAFATPFVALLLAGLIGAMPRRAGRLVLGLVLAVQATSIAGLLTRAETMQLHTSVLRAAAAFAGRDGLVLLGRGNDGVGLVGAALRAAPDDLRLHLVTLASDPASLRAVARHYPRVALALLGPDAESRAAVVRMTEAFADQACWRDRPAASNLRTLDRICQE